MIISKDKVAYGNQQQQQMFSPQGQNGGGQQRLTDDMMIQIKNSSGSNKASINNRAKSPMPNSAAFGSNAPFQAYLKVQGGQQDPISKK